MAMLSSILITRSTGHQHGGKDEGKGKSSLCMILHHGGGITAMAKGTWSCCPQN